MLGNNEGGARMALNLVPFKRVLESISAEDAAKFKILPITIRPPEVAGEIIDVIGLNYPSDQLLDRDFCLKHFKRYINVVGVVDYNTFKKAYSLFYDDILR